MGLAAVFAMALASDARASSVSSYLKLEGVPGEANPPGQNGAIAVDSIGLGSAALQITKHVDSSSASLAAAETAGTLFNDLTLSFYDDPNTAAAPDATLVLHTGLIQSIQSLTLGGQPAENVALDYASPNLAIFLVLPGVSGESSSPGFSGVIQLQSVVFSANGFTIEKAIDATSSTLQAKLLAGTPYTTAMLLFYTDLATETHPDFSLVYHNALETRFSDSGAEDRFVETVGFEGGGDTTVGHPLPEPVGGCAVALGLLALARKRRR